MSDEVKVPQIVMIPIEEIYSDADFNCRGSIDPLSVLDLSKDIKAHGLLQPVIVQPYTDMDGKKYRILAGHRRHKACMVNGMKQISCTIMKDLSVVDAHLLNLCENVQRKDLNILQEAHAVQRLRALGLTEHECATKIGMSRGWVQVRLMLLTMPEPIQKEAEAGVLNQTQIREIYGLPTTVQQFDYVKEIKDAKLFGARKVEKKIAVIKRESNSRRSRNRDEIFAMQRLVQDATYITNFGAKTLAWAAGEIDDMDLHKAIKYEASKLGRNYLIPEIEGVLKEHYDK